MDTRDYVNSERQRNRLEREGHRQSGPSKVLLVVVVSFCLLCIVQSALNVSLRLQRSGSKRTDSSDATLMSAADIGALLLEKDQLGNENRALQTNNSRLTGDNKMLNDQLKHRLDQITELRTMLSGEAGAQSCPPGWRLYVSSCYQLSTERQNWRFAREDCKAKEAHLVILDDQWEQDAIHTFGRSVVWVGLRAKLKNGSKTWSWVDGRRLTRPDRIQPQPDDGRFYCAYSRQSQFGWVRAVCGERHHWVCEKELK